MGTTNHGTQDITYNYFEEATAEDFNKRHLSIRLRGIYDGGYLTKVNNTEVTLSLFTLEIGDDNEQISSKSTVNATLKSTTLDSGDIDSATPYIVFRWLFTELVSNFVEIHAIATVASAQDNDIIIGKCIFSGATLTGFDYSDRTFLDVQNIVLRVEVTSAVEMYVRVRAGRIQNSSGYVLIPEQKVGVFTAPSSPNSRIDLVYVDSTGTISILQGTVAPSPSVPDYGGKLVLAEVTLVNGDTNIVSSRIKDVRSSIPSSISTAGTYFGTRTDKDSLNNTFIISSTYKAESDGFFLVRADGPNSGCGFKIYIDSVKASVDSELDSVCRGGDYSGYYSYGSTLVVPVKINEYVRTNKLVNATIQNIEWMPFGTGDLVKQ